MNHPSVHDLTLAFAQLSIPDTVVQEHMSRTFFQSYLGPYHTALHEASVRILLAPSSKYITAEAELARAMRTRFSKLPDHLNVNRELRDDIYETDAERLLRDNVREQKYHQHSLDSVIATLAQRLLFDPSCSEWERALLTRVGERMYRAILEHKPETPVQEFHTFVEAIRTI